MNKKTLFWIYLAIILSIGVSFGDSIFAVFTITAITSPILFLINILQQKITEKKIITITKVSLSLIGLCLLLTPIFLLSLRVIYPTSYLSIAALGLILPFFFLIPKTCENQRPIQRIIFFDAMTVISFSIDKAVSHLAFPGMPFVSGALICLSVIFQTITLMLLAGYYNSYIFESRPRTFSNILFDSYGKQTDES